MEICLIDLWRNVTYQAVPGLSPCDTIKKLAHDHSGDNPHLEFRADKEFFDAFFAEALDGSHPGMAIKSAEESGRRAWTGKRVIPVSTFKGIPIVIAED